MNLLPLLLREDKYKYEHCHAGTQQHHSGKTHKTYFNFRCSSVI